MSRPFFAADPAAPGPRRALILPGGGMRLSYQAGVVRALLDEGLRFQVADGTSGGSLNLAMLLSGQDGAQMCNNWRGLAGTDFVSLLPLTTYLKSPNLPAMGDADTIHSKVIPKLGIDFAKLTSASDIQATFNIGEFTRKTSELFQHTEMDAELLVAGMSLPVLLPPVPRDGKLYLDAAWSRDCNLMAAVRAGAEELWVIWGLGNTPHYGNGLLNQYVAMLELTAHGALFNEFEQINELNQHILAGNSRYGQTAPIRLHLIRPDHPLPLDPDLILGRIDHGSLVDMGYADGKRYLQHMAPEGQPFTPEVTQMSDSKPGIRFRETMAGHFALDATEPKAGAELGKQQDCSLAMHATVTIRDMQRFIDDPGHLGELTGNIDFAPFGMAIPATSGVFNLFSPTDDPQMKYMVYELGFEHEGQPYYLAGHKEVKDDPGFDLWSDTTTLYTTLHKGSSKDDPVVGAGVLSLGVTDLLSLMRSMAVIDSDGLGDDAATLAKFGRFFIGELWDSYFDKL